MAGTRVFLFMDSIHSSNDTRNRELQRSQALSHAARASHPSNRKVSAKDIGEEDLLAGIHALTRPPEGQHGTYTPRADEKILDEGHDNPQQHRDRRKKVYDMQKWRLIQKGSYIRAADSTRQRLRQDRPTNTVSVPKPHKGNSDPFDSTPIPFTALVLALIRDDRTNLVDIVWPAEISIRRNHSSLLDTMWKFMPGILDGPETAHAIISHSHYSRAVRHVFQGQRDQSAMALAEKHKMLAVRGLRGLVEAYHQTQDRNLLNQIRAASAQLAACGVISGDTASAQVHFAGVKMTVDIMGGLKKMVPMQYEALVFSQVSNAWFSRSRPVFHPREWDPGSWSDYRRTLPKFLVSTLDKSAPSPSVLHPNDWSQPSAIFSRLRAIINELREVNHVEEIKPALTASNDENAAQVFRWSSLRKLAIRARNIRLWCDLKDFMADPDGHSILDNEIRPGSVSAAAFNVVICLTARTFDRAVFEEHYYHDQPTFRFSTMFFAEVAANAQRLTPPFPGYDESLNEPDKEERALADERRFDVLWVYSVGAYVEDCETGPIQRCSDTRSRDSMVSSTTTQRQGPRDTSTGGVGLFGARFATLAKVLGFDNLEEVTSLLSERYLYCARLQNESLRKLLLL